MTARVDEIAADLFRISAFHPDFGIQFNHFLLRDDEPTLIHTGFRSAFEQTAEAVARIVDPKTLRWIGFSHFESDECGALNRGDGRQAIRELAGVLGEASGPHAPAAR